MLLAVYVNKVRKRVLTGQKINLTVNRDSQAFAIGVHNNGDVYVGGYYTSNHHYWIPCFWKNGTSRTNLQSGEDGEVYDMVLMDGTTRYYAGNTTSLNNMLGYPPRACYWKNTRRNQLPKGGNFNSGPANMANMAMPYHDYIS